MFHQQHMLTSREHRQSAEGVGMYRVQREWACSECRGSGHVVSAEGVGMYRVQREWACSECRGSGCVVSAEGVGV